MSNAKILTQRQGIMDAVGALWPDLITGPVDWVEEGWDFRVAVIDHRFVVRVARTSAAAWRLKREAALLQCLASSPVALPQYERQARGLVVYPYIAGKPVEGTPELGVREEIAHFISWLHTQAQPQPRGDVRQTWHRRAVVFCRRLQDRALPLFSVRERRKLQEAFTSGLALIAASEWQPVLLHGDLNPEHVLLGSDGHLSGVIDFGDWRWGDPAFDWSGIAGLDEVLPSPWSLSAAFRQRLTFYRLLAPFHGMEFGLKMGHVEMVERQIRRVHRQLLLSE